MDLWNITFSHLTLVHQTVVLYGDISPVTKSLCAGKLWNRKRCRNESCCKIFSYWSQQFLTYCTKTFGYSLQELFPLFECKYILYHCNTCIRGDRNLRFSLLVIIDLDNCHKVKVRFKFLTVLYANLRNHNRYKT